MKKKGMYIFVTRVNLINKTILNKNGIVLVSKVI
jgi:hypothetical protein